MQEHADSAWVLILLPVPLTLWTLLAGSAVGDPSFVNHPQAAVPFLPAFLEKERMPGWATHGSIWLESKVLA
jgi:hypothetical protein